MTQTNRIAIVDYGMGNLRSVEQALRHVVSGGDGAEVMLASSPEVIESADRVVFPGQGAMRDCVAELDARNLRQAVINAAASKPFLGICIGLQMLFEHSEEGDAAGLGILPGQVKRFAGDMNSADGQRLKVPHMGWNQVDSTMGPNDPMLRGMGPKPYFYFVHSYHAVLENESQGWLTSHYGYEFCAAVRRGNLLATQFHPEKSQANGIGLLRNFLTLSTNQCEAYQATTNAG